MIDVKSKPAWDRVLPGVISLWDLISVEGLPPHRFIADADDLVVLSALDGGTTLDTDIEAFRDRSVLIWAERQLAAALAMAELDGVARRIILCPPDLAAAHLPLAIVQAGADMAVWDGHRPLPEGCERLRWGRCGAAPVHNGVRPLRDHATEWLLFTSGTSGVPKMVVHTLASLTLASLTGPVQNRPEVSDIAVWSTFYDIRRYGGLQILLRAFLSGGSMVLSDPRETAAQFLQRAGAKNVTHISGTPSHWRRALMSAAAAAVSPGYVRLSGEVADQAVLDNLAMAFPDASIAHAYASTEAGVAFDVRDGLAGFPAALIGNPDAKIEMRVHDGSLQIRSARTACGYAGTGMKMLKNSEGFVDTGDMVEQRGDRYHFIGRREGQINIGGLKVHPEEVEAAVNRHPGVQMSRVRPRPSPITGAIVVADVVLKPSYDGAFEVIKSEILSYCRSVLCPHKVPAFIRLVPSLEIAASGKLIRQNA